MRTKHVLLLSALLSLFATVAFAADRRVHQTVNLDQNGRFELVAHNGSITVTTWNQPRVEIDARIEPGEWGYEEDVDKVDIRISGSGRSVRVETNYDKVGYHTSGWLFVSSNRSLPPVHYTISLPAGAAVDIEEHNASVRVSGLTADVRVSGHNGRIDVLDHAGAADITAHNGDIRVAFTRFGKASEIETHNGSIEVRMPGDSRFDIDASGHHMGVDSDFPVVAKSLSRGTYVGNVNGGGTPLRISTHNGSVRLRRS